MTNLLVPLDAPAFFSLAVCSETDEPQLVRLISIAPRKVTGTVSSSVTFRVAWPAPEDILRYAAGPAQKMGAAYLPVDNDDEGLVLPCITTTQSTGLEIAIIVPDPQDAAVVVKGVAVVYEVGEDRFREDATVTLGVCSADPAAPKAEPAECQAMADAIAER